MENEAGKVEGVGGGSGQRRRNSRGAKSASKAVAFRLEGVHRAARSIGRRLAIPPCAVELRIVRSVVRPATATRCGRSRECRASLLARVRSGPPFLPLETLWHEEALAIVLFKRSRDREAVALACCTMETAAPRYLASRAEDVSVSSMVKPWWVHPCAAVPSRRAGKVGRGRQRETPPRV